VISHQVIRSSGHGDSSRQKAHFQLAQVFFATAIGVGDERVDKDSPLHSLFEGSLDFDPVKAEDNNFDALPRFLNRFNERLDPIPRLCQ